MKPLNLKISAFGPYKNEIEIDFKKLGNSGIFLITGDTGAGKTTIFDAISYALFGEVSGSNRQISSLRSDFANDETETFVELEFNHKNKIYKIRRNPPYEKAKKRGEGTTKKTADASIEFDDTIISGTKNVDSKIEEILGINAKQFKQIAMLAQGEFLKILFAESKDRTEIFRRIFDTDIYNQISKKLVEKTKITRAELEQLKSIFTINASNIIWEDEHLKEPIKEINELIIDEILNKLQEEVQKNKKAYNSSDKEIKKQEKQISKLEEEIRIQDDKNKQIDLQNELLVQKRELEEKKDEIKEKENLILKIQNIINKVLPIEKRLKEVKNEILQKQELFKSLEQNIIKGEEEEKASKNTIEILDKIKIILQKYNELLSQKVEYENNIKKVNEVFKQIENKKHLEENCKKLEADWENIKKYLSEKEIEFFREQAGILAENLKENQPCPVCGSTHHPNLAQKTESVLSKEKLDELRKIEETSHNVFTDAINKVTEVNSKIDILKSDFEKDIEIEAYQKELKEKFDKNEKDINEKYLEINNYYNQITGKNIKIDEFDYDKFKDDVTNKIANKREQLLKNKTLLEENQKYLVELENKQIAENKQYEEALKNLGFENEEEYKKTVYNEKQLETLKKEIDEYKKIVTINNTKLEEIEKVIKDYTKIDLTESKKSLDENREKLDKSRKILMEQNKIFGNNERILKELVQNSSKLKSKIKEFIMIEDLSKTASGTISGKRRIEFEQFVQASYFELVIAEANKRLLKMTDNRFVLVRKESSDKVSDKIGLELEVIDNYSGKKRDVKSLSGGESFKAALSLALGLSDVIQSYSGGIVVDTMFIDEGFGSLDDESREQAINTLNQLTDNNKLIGIISHVTELKERIDKKIIITKSQEGSNINIEL